MSTKRWIEASSDATELERALIASGLDAEPPVEAEGAVWQSLASTLGVPLPPVGATASTAASAKAVTGMSALVTLGKGFALGVAVSLGLVGVARLEASHERAERPLATHESPVAPRATPVPGVNVIATPNPLPELPRAESSADALDGTRAELQASANPPRAPSPQSVPAVSSPAPAPRAAGTSSVAAFPVAEGRGPSGSAELERRSQLEEEATLLRHARAELRANRLAEAFATLEAAREKFSLPELNQEREALLIELLFQSGQRASAVGKAQRFLVQYPNSPHSAQMRSIAHAEAR